MRARARGKRAVERDELVLDAALMETALHGVDQLGMVAVARRAGLTAGSVYSRHENVAELLVAIWLERCARPTLDLVTGAVNRALGVDSQDFGRAPFADIAGVTGVAGVDVLMRRSAAVVVGVEILAIARRHPELAEEVVPALEEILRWHDRTDLERARIATLLGLVLGCVVHGGSSAVDVDRWRSVFGLVVDAVAVAPSTPPTEWNPARGRAVRADTGEPLRDALLDATCAVIARSGLVAATNSRIARRAGLTPGAVYTRYDAKDDLVIDTMRSLLDDAIGDNEPVTSGLDSAERMGHAAAQLLSRGGGDERRPWLRFRLEMYLVATHRRDLAAVLDEIHEIGRRRYEEMLAPAGLRTDVAGWVALVGQSIPLGLAILDCYAPGIESIDFRPVALPLLAAVAAS